jgi:hypothetical protein
MSIELKVYVVRNQDGQFFKAKGFGGSGPTWVDDIQRARIYPKIGQARGRVTWFANNYPDYGVPDIIELTASKAKVIKEEDRVKKKQAQQQRALLEYQKKRTQAEKKRLLQQERDIRARLNAIDAD